MKLRSLSASRGGPVWCVGRHPLGCVRFRPGVVLRERVGPRHARPQERAVRGSGPAQVRAFLSAACARPRKPHPRGRTPAQRRRILPGRERIEIMTRKSTQPDREAHRFPHPASSPVHHLRTGHPPRPASEPGRQPRSHLRPGSRRLRQHPRRDRGAHRQRRQGIRDGAEREGPANPPATDHRRFRRLRLRSRPVLRHQEVGGDGTHQQAAQRRPRRGP